MPPALVKVPPTYSCDPLPSSKVHSALTPPLGMPVPTVDQALPFQRAIRPEPAPPAARIEGREAVRVAADRRREALPARAVPVQHAAVGIAEQVVPAGDQ